MNTPTEKIKQLFFALSFLFMFSMSASEETREVALEEDTLAILERSQRIAEQFYSLEENEEIKEITEDILNSHDTKDSIKETILQSGRRFFLLNTQAMAFK